MVMMEVMIKQGTTGGGVIFDFDYDYWGERARQNVTTIHWLLSPNHTPRIV